MINFSLYNPRTGGVKKNVKEMASKIFNKHAESITKFYTYHSKPEALQIQSFESNNIAHTRQHFMMIASIRKIVMIEADSNNETLRKSSCTCPD